MTLIFNSDVFDVRYHRYILAHQVNCMGKMGSGVALYIKRRFPDVYAKYLKLCNKYIPCLLLGYAQIEQSVFRGHAPIANIFGQESYGYSGWQYTNYNAFEKAFNMVCRYCKENEFPGIVVPYKIGCVRGGGSWNVILEIMNRLTLLYQIELVIVSNENKPTNGGLL